MRRQIATNYTFSPGVAGDGTITLNDYSSNSPITLGKILGIINVTKGVSIFNPNSTTQRISISGNVITITDVDTSTHSSGDVLDIFIESGVVKRGVLNSAVNQISHVNITNGGSGYTSAPTVGFTGGTGTTSTATAIVVDQVVVGVRIDTSGVYTVLPTAVTFTGGGGSGAVGTVVGGENVKITLDEQSSMEIQVLGTWVGTIQFEGSIDGMNFFSVNTANASGTIATGITSNYNGDAEVAGLKYFQLRMSAYTSGNAIVNISSSNNPGPISLSKNIFLGGGTVATVTTVSAVTSITNGVNIIGPTQATDIASAAITTSANVTTGTISFGNSYEVFIPVTVVSGTNPTLDVDIEESEDGGINFFKVYSFPRITATGAYRSPKLPLTTNRIRYVQTVGGTTPSFTRSVVRNTMTDSVPMIRQLVDRTVSLTTLNSTTPSLRVQNCTNAKLVFNLGGATTPPQLKIQGSDDEGATWYDVSTALTGVASSTVQITVNNVNSQLIRAIVSTIGVTVTAGYVLLRGFY